jgi:hypothetical protein
MDVGLVDSRLSLDNYNARATDGHGPDQSSAAHLVESRLSIPLRVIREPK